MLFNIKTILTGIVLAVAGMTFSQPAHATFFTELGVLNVNNANPAKPAPIGGINLISQSQGQTFTNSTGVDLATGGVDVRTVGIAVITGVNNPAGLTQILGPGSTVQSLAVVFALSGATSAGAPNSVNFTTGGFAVFALPSAVPNGTFVPSDPNTWGVTFTAANEIISGILSPQTNVTQGTPTSGTDRAAPVSVPASQVNVSGTNSKIASNFQGNTLFEITNTGSPTFVSIDPASTPPAGPGIISIFTQFSENIDNPTQPVDASALAVLNSAAGLFLNNLGGAGTAFATGQNGAVATDFAPGGANPINTLGDFSGNLGDIKSYVGIEQIPEPSSVVLLATGSILAGLFARRRKNAKKA